MIFMDDEEEMDKHCEEEKWTIPSKTNLVHPRPPLNMMPTYKKASFQVSCEHHFAMLLAAKSSQPDITSETL